MKGKGKGDRGGSSKQSQAAAQASQSDKEDCPLQFPDMKPVDHTRICPRYTAVLQRSDEDGIGVEELDTMQTELETLLASVAKRMRQLEAEISILSNWQDNKNVKGLDTKIPKSGKTPEGKRAGKGGDDKPNKKFKDSKGSAVSVNTTPSRLPNTKVGPQAKTKGQTPSTKLPDYEFSESPKPPEPRLLKNDASNKFWAMVEPYCTEINKEDLQVLEEIMRSHEDDAEYHKVPGLGKHYSQKWAQEDMIEEQREGSKVNEKRRSATTNNNTNSNSNDASVLLKRAEEKYLSCRDDDSSPFGPLTQRLVSALIEENIMTPLDDSAMTEAAEAASMSPRSLAKQLNIGNTTQLERRIKRELEEQGILESDDRSDENPEDEILCELRKKQQELRVLSQHNLLMTKRLYKMAKEEMARQDLRRKMAAADADVMDAYRKIQAARQKKKAPTKKERDAATRALKEREAIIRQLESM